MLRDAAERLLDRLDDTTRRFTHALDVGGRGVVAPLLRARGHGGRELRSVGGNGGLNGGPAVAADEELLPFAPGSFDLVVASLSLHWVNDLPGALIQLRQALRPDGLLLASLPALGTLAELRAGADRGGGCADRRRRAARLAVSRTARLRGAAAARRLRAAGGRCRGGAAALRRSAGAAARFARGGRGQRDCACASAGCRPRAVPARAGRACRRRADGFPSHCGWRC